MDRERVISELPEALAVALRLQDAGHSDETIACALGLPVQSVSVILRVATAKFSRLAESHPEPHLRAVASPPPWRTHWREADQRSEGTG